ncbi:MAG: RNA 3'-terminal phosphate cyclase [Maricaulis sp.]|uniref:RNA 3'-terminal phosphate cyclase n=1 Tax=Maricaulis sp. TaxID=1486257 RepID=UPI001B08C5AB|nr:RNA 3'-terminal phosphate cyclase [Maricaulis sp.]MBO6848776.1 RNA 3'-terminal phosphate cyclase [Maricaulis sp.]MBO6878377.1 RNA 3'-terminal phosphate cyclase [Maricaulis sp.]
MIRIDGSRGEGGGQIVRSALALSMATGQSFTIDNIRAGRKKPGLMRQHLTSVLAAREVCDGKVDGAELGSTAITFHPGEICGGDYHFPIGTAGGTGLVFQTVFPALLLADEPSTVKLEGGTHNGMSPPFEFLRDSFLGAMATIGIEASLEMDRAGFYPAGGGIVRASINPAALDQKIDLTDRGELKQIHGEARIANLPGGIAEREAKTLRAQLDLDEGAIRIRNADALGPGNALLAWIEFEGITEVYCGVGEHGVRAERIAERVAKSVRRHLRSNAVVGPHLADQLLLPMALGSGGRFTMMRPSLHFETNVETVLQFLDTPIRYMEENEGLWLVEVG